MASAAFGQTRGQKAGRALKTLRPSTRSPATKLSIYNEKKDQARTLLLPALVEEQKNNRADSTIHSVVMVGLVGLEPMTFTMST